MNNNAWEVLKNCSKPDTRVTIRRSRAKAVQLYIRVLGCLVFLWALSTALYASDQTVVISQTPRVCNGIPQPLTLANSESAIQAALNITAVDHNTYYMIHDVSYNSDGSVMEQHWYVFLHDWNQNHSVLENLEDTRIRHHFEETRIYGSHDVAIVYFHRNIVAVSAEVAINKATPQIGMLVSADPPNPITEADIGALVNNKVIGGDPNAGGHKTIASFDLVNSVTGNKLGGFQAPGQAAYVVDTPFINITKSLTYTIDITKQVPAPIQNLEGIASLIGAHGGSRSLPITVDQQITLCGGQAFEVTPLPSLMNVTATVNGSSDKKTEIGKNTYDNEQKYWYDFSLALPLKSFNDLTVDSSNLTLTAKSVQKQSLFAMVNLSLPYDTKKANFQLIPVFLYGVPITGKPLNHHLVAGAIGLNRVQFFVGVMFNHNKEVPNAPINPPNTTNSTSTGSGAVKDSWNAKLSYGINFPVSTITNLLKKK